MVKDVFTRAQIRHDHFDLHLSIHEVARRLHIGRNTVRHWLRCEDPKPRPHSETRVFLDSHQEELKELFSRVTKTRAALRRKSMSSTASRLGFAPCNGS